MSDKLPKTACGGNTNSGSVEHAPEIQLFPWYLLALAVTLWQELLAGLTFPGPHFLIPPCVVQPGLTTQHGNTKRQPMIRNMPCRSDTSQVYLHCIRDN